MTYPAIPITHQNEAQHRRVIAEKVNQVNQGKFNCYIELTLTHDASSTDILDARLGATSVLSFMPVTLTAAVELTSLYVPENLMKAGQATVNHSNSATTDRSYRVGIFG